MENQIKITGNKTVIQREHWETLKVFADVLDKFGYEVELSGFLIPPKNGAQLPNYTGTKAAITNCVSLG